LATSLEYNKKATELDAENRCWWNLGIAATALMDWRTARQAWKSFGLSLEINDIEPDMNIAGLP